MLRGVEVSQESLKIYINIEKLIKSKREAVDSIFCFIFAEYNQSLRVLGGCYEGLKAPKKVREIEKRREIK